MTPCGYIMGACWIFRVILQGHGGIRWVRGIPWLSHLRLRSLCTPSSGEMRRRISTRQISYDVRLSPGHKSLFQGSKDELNSRDLNSREYGSYHMRFKVATLLFERCDLVRQKPAFIRTNSKIYSNLKIVEPR